MIYDDKIIIKYKDTTFSMKKYIFNLVLVKHDTDTNQKDKEVKKNIRQYLDNYTLIHLRNQKRNHEPTNIKNLAALAEYLVLKEYFKLRNTEIQHTRLLNDFLKKDIEELKSKILLLALK